jgi:muconolactone delta-isomerase
MQVAVDGVRVPIPPAMSPDEVNELLAQPSARARGDFLRAWLLKRGGGVIHEPPPGPPDPAWQEEVEALLARIRARVPPDMTSEEIEALITEASEEARPERIARRERGGD